MHIKILCNTNRYENNYFYLDYLKPLVLSSFKLCLNLNTITICYLHVKKTVGNDNPGFVRDKKPFKTVNIS